MAVFPAVAVAVAVFPAVKNLDFIFENRYDII